MDIHHCKVDCPPVKSQRTRLTTKSDILHTCIVNTEFLGVAIWSGYAYNQRM